MSTIEISCARCEKKFRVRAEFSGRSTRCPGCSAPITIAGATVPPPLSPKRVEEERPRPAKRAREDDDEPRRPVMDLKSAVTACRREQVALIFALAGILGGFFVACAGNMSRAGGGMEEIMLFLVLLFAVGPSLATGAFGIMARISAMSVPSTSLARGSATSSFLCSIAGIVCLLAFAIALVSSIDSHQPNELPMVVALGGLILSVIGSVVTFVGFVGQIGIVRRSSSVSRAVGRTSIATAVCVLSLIGIGLLYTLANEAFGGPDYYRGPYGPAYHYQDHSNFYQVMLGIFMPIAFGVVLILYHRLLAAGKIAAQNEMPVTSMD